MKRLLLLMWGLWLLWPLASLAGAGDPCELPGVGGAQVALSGTGQMKPIWCVKLIDDVSTGSGGPIEFNLANVRGLPDAIRFEVGTDNDCASGTGTIQTALTPGGARSNLPSSPTLDLDSSSPAGNTAITVNLHDVPIGLYLETSWTGVAGCGGGVDILAVGYEAAH